MERFLEEQTQHTTSPEHAEAHGHDESGPQAVLFVFFGLLCGSILRQVNKKTKIPYTPMLLVLGIFFGYCSDHFGVIGESINIIEDMSPHMILLVFIPVLIFESAFNCDWHVFRKSMINILLLAGPGVLWGAVIIAFIFKNILGYGDDLSWTEALALGCVLSATDPVAVVALLKDLGASVRFNTLVEGESLCNDGTAMVFFMLFMGMVKDSENIPSTGQVIANFARVSLGGPLLGILIGFLMNWWMKKIIRDSVLSVNITFIAAYLCFYLAEFTWLHVSGILSIVSLGLYCSAVCKKKIYPQSEHALHNVWASIQFACETIIFILTGIVVGFKMTSESTITAGDWVKMFFFWILMIIARIIMVLTLYPILSRTGYGLTRKQLVVLIYGGLRGALGMCLALFVGVDDSLRDRFRDLTVFYMCGMAMLTIIVNGLTCNKLVNYIQMIKIPQIKTKLLKRCLKKILQSTQLRLKQLKTQTSLSHAKWKEVQNYASIKKLGNTVHERVSQKKSDIQIRDSLLRISKHEVIEQIRFRFTRYLDKLAWEYFEEGQISEDSVGIIHSSCCIAIDESHLKIRYFEIISSFFAFSQIQYLQKMKDWPLIGNEVKKTIRNKIYFAYEICVAFCEICEEIQHKFYQSFPLHQDHLKVVEEQVRENVENAETFLGELQSNYTKIIQVVHTERAATMLLKSKKSKLKQLFEEGYIDEVDYTVLRKEIDQSLYSVRENSYKEEDFKISQVINQCPLFSTLTPQEIVKIRMKSTQKIYPKNSTILKQEDSIPFAMVILSGSVKEEFENFHLMRSIGSIINPYDFTYKQPSKCKAKTRSQVKLLEIDENLFFEIFNQNDDFKKKWFKSLFTYCLWHNSKVVDYLHKQLSDKQMRRFIESADVVLVNAGETFDFVYGGYVFKGQLECDRNVYVKGNFVSKDKVVKCLTDSILLNFKYVLGASIEDERMSILNEQLE